jgi:hypothetical protein
MTIRARPANDAEYWVAIRVQDGRVMAQGDRELCERVAARGPWTLDRMGDLFDSERS